MSYRSLLIVCILLILNEIHSKRMVKNQANLLQRLDKVAIMQNTTEAFNATVENKPIGPRNCIFRIEQGDLLISVNKTRQEIESEGKIIFDEICEGDLDANGDKISSGALASLCCG